MSVSNALVLKHFPWWFDRLQEKVCTFRKPQTFVVTKSSLVSPHLLKICDSLRSSCVIVKFVTNLCSHYSLEATCSQSFVPQSLSNSSWLAEITSLEATHYLWMGLNELPTALSRLRSCIYSTRNRVSSGVCTCPTTIRIMRPRR